MQSGKRKKQSDCLAIVGSEAGCGKTTFMAGMAGALREQGFKTRAIKPIVLGESRTAEPELSFISLVSHTPRGYPQIIIDKLHNLNETAWHNAINQSRTPDTLTLIELPGGCATPLRFSDKPSDSKTLEWIDTANVLAQANIPCILVAKHSASAIEELVLNAYYLTMQRVFVLGLATVETSSGMGADLENRMTRDDFSMALFTRTGAPYLGCIKHSISVSVPRCNQGNLIKLTSGGLDLLAVMKALNLTVSV
ncbi:MAG TPA: AAA family ATPase [Drouetiella sp.]